MTALFTRRDYEALPEGLRSELCDGMLLKQPTPRYGHQRVLARAQRALVEHVGWSRVATGPVDLLIDELNVFVPDLVVFGEGPEAIPADGAQYVTTPLLVVEVLSPSTRERDRDFKTRRYLGQGVREVWLIDIAEQMIEVVSIDDARVHAGESTAASDVLPGLRLRPEELFAPAT